MKGPCLRRWEHIELGMDADDALRVHLEGCTDCRTEHAWRERERAWFTQRALRTPERPALSWEALEARIERSRETGWRPIAPTRRNPWRHWFLLALPAAAACLLAILPVMGPPSREDAAQEDATPVLACFASDDALLRHLETSVGACLAAPVSMVTQS